MKMLSEFG